MNAVEKKSIEDQPFLAIVIPYYKSKFFKELLHALSTQTNLDFKVYVGDDCSPERPDSILANAPKNLDIHYRRFESRLGHISLAAHWNRCLEMTQNETWIWVIPDDDLPSPHCVADFKSALSDGGSEGVNVFVLPLRVIDSAGHILSRPKALSGRSKNYDFYLQQLKGEVQGSSLGENIFRREALMGRGGFVELPKGWGSDHATILRASAGSLIAPLNRAWFGFRQSGDNISSQRDDGAEKMRARVLFAHWLRENAALLSSPPSAEFYRYFYWKGEYYALHHWKFSAALFWQLLRLRWVCLRSANALAVVRLFLTKRRHGGEAAR